MSVCIFCFNHIDREIVWCSYGMHHEYLDIEEKKKTQQKQVAKADLNKCLKCGLHRKNPSSPTNGCEHEYPAP